MVPVMVADSAMTLPRKPPATFPTVSTADSEGATERLTTVWRAVITWAATTTASMDWWGAAAWPPRPSMAMRKAVGAAKNGPGATFIAPMGMSALMGSPRAMETWGDSRTPAAMQAC